MSPGRPPRYREVLTPQHTTQLRRGVVADLRRRRRFLRRCHCPADSAPSLSAPTGTGVAPAFRVRFGTASTTLPGVVRVDVSGCTRLTETCLQFPATGVEGEGRAGLTALVALKPALSTQPSAAVTVLGNVSGNSAMAAYNTDPERGGVTLQAGGTISLTRQGSAQRAQHDRDPTRWPPATPRCRR